MRAVINTTHANFFIGLFSDQFIRFKKMARLSYFLYRLAFSPGTSLSKPIYCKHVRQESPSRSAVTARVPARTREEGRSWMEALITALSSDLYPAYYSVRINPRATTANERVGAHRTKSKLNSAATLTRLHEPGERSRQKYQSHM